jgi:hypothetical protein
VELLMGKIQGRGLKTVILTTVTVLSLFLSGCLSLTERTGKFLEGDWAYTAHQYRSPKAVPKGQGYQVRERAGRGGEGLDILFESLPFITLRASLPAEDGSFYLKSLDYRGGSFSGWVEFSLALSGGGTFIAREEGLSTLRLRPPTEAALITGGRISRGGRRLSSQSRFRVPESRRDRSSSGKSFSV